ncbi:two-component regulator propeller domain-containing protein [Desulfosudis oleivorans]|uniref:Two component regulator propeller domain protein n=1 Tax=Desulfosudis oleivorans (strain DSM 6200 / JCM 39069 / Hxd3) TaxID=96561 RepID=A8ZVD9_DESOH|nr:two-component regulator propeller domain-containing protein [Desulfosudis oleivorans]ABW66600.1 two component regulator propeller domain protein [Desulfosudis oleivorans Hxd3]
MKTIAPTHSCHAAVAALLLALFLTPVTAPDAQAAEWVNYPRQPDIIYYLAIEPVTDTDYYVWAGTETGAFRIHAVDDTYVRYTYADGLSYNSVKSILVDSAGDKWFGTMNGGLNHFDDTTWTLFPSPDITPINEIALNGLGFPLLARGDFLTELAGLGGFHVFNGADWAVYNAGNSDLAANYVEALLVDGSGNVWLGTCPPPLGFLVGQPGGLNMFDGTNWTTYDKSDGLVEENVSDIAADSSGDLWIATLFGGISHFDGATWTSYTTANSDLPNGNVQAVAVDANDTKWFGTTMAGVCSFDGFAWTPYDTDNSGLVNNNIHAIALHDTPPPTEAASGTDPIARVVVPVFEPDVWLGTGNGVNRLDSTGAWTTFSFDGIFNSYYTAAAADAGGNKWFGTHDGVVMFDDTDWTTYTTENSGLAGNNIRAIIVSSDGNIWFATNAGASWFDGTDWATYNTGNSGLVSDGVSCLAEDISGSLWFGTSAGASVFDGTTWTTYTITNSDLVSDAVQAVCAAGDGSLWFGTDAGVSVFDGGTWTTYTTANSDLVADDINTIVESSTGLIGIGTDSGMSMFDGGTWTTLDVAGGSLIANTVRAIIEDSEGEIWVGTTAGVSRFDGAAWSHYDRGDGPGDPSIRAMALESDGDLWFATGNGVTGYVIPPEPEPEPEPEPVPDPPLVPDTSIGCFITGLMR